MSRRVMDQSTALHVDLPYVGSAADSWRSLGETGCRLLTHSCVLNMNGLDGIEPEMVKDGIVRVERGHDLKSVRRYVDMPVMCRAVWEPVQQSIDIRHVFHCLMILNAMNTIDQNIPTSVGFQAPRSSHSLVDRRRLMSYLRFSPEHLTWQHIPGPSHICVVRR